MACWEENRMKKSIFAIVCLLPVLVCQAAIITVDDNGPADYNNIQDAIDHSSNGDTIIVKPGTYIQNIAFNNKAVTVTSQDPNVESIVQSTIITASSGDCVTFEFGEDSNSVITGFTIKATTGRGIRCHNTSPTISKNVIKNCADSGIYGELNAAPIISGNTIKSNAGVGIYSCNGRITDNSISGNNGGISSCNGPITNNIINSNVASSYGGGLYNCQGEIAGNIIANNQTFSKGGGLYGCNGNISNNAIVGNSTYVDGGGLCSCQGNIGNNIIAGNVGSRGGGLYGCGGTIYNNTITGNRASYLGGAICYCNGYVRNNIIAFNEAIGMGSTIGGIEGPCSNSYNAFWNNQGGNFGKDVVASTGDIILDPFFAVNGHWDNRGTSDPSDDLWIDGDYHVKSKAGRWDPNNEVWVTDSVTSPCIDAGDPNSDWTAELWPHGKRINMGTYGGTPEASMSTSSVGNVADINEEDWDANWVDYNDFILLTDKWLSDEVLLAEDLNRDRMVNLADFAIFAGNWRPGPPVPNPMTWATPPYATSTSSIAMAATTATSTDWNGVEYYFKDFQHPQFNSGWISFAPGQEPRWEHKNLTPNTKYWYKVKARNKSNLLETDWSEIASATTFAEHTTPPTPDPMTWATEPYATSPTSIRMVATTAYDDSGVQYFFECTSDATYSSPSWQNETEYTRSSLPKGVYTFVVRAQDKSPNHNTTGNSNAVTVDLKPPTPDPMTWKTEPCATSPTSIRMVATTASDGSGVQYFFECTSHPNYSSPSWQDETEYTRSSLPPGVYTFVTRARDKSPNQNTTGNSTAVTVDIKPPTPNPMTWATPPYASSPISIASGLINGALRMVATTASDVSGVQYYFQCTSDANYSSPDWQDSPTYQVSSLPQGLYTFVVRARDKSPNQNTTANSTAVTVDLKPPTPAPPNLQMDWAEGGEPKEIYGGGGWNYYYATMTAVECSDESGTVEYYFECTTDEGFDSVWLSFAPGQPCTYTVRVGRPGQRIWFRVKARDLSHNETGWSPELPMIPL